jgi:autotransporter family porin
VNNGNLGVINVGLGTGGGRTLIGDLVNAGILLFTGASPYALTVTSNYTQSSTGTLTVRLAGCGAGQYDQLHVTGLATLDGSLAVGLLGGFLPGAGDVFQVVTHGTRGGIFASLLAPDGVALRIVYDDLETRLTI